MRALACLAAVGLALASCAAPVAVPLVNAVGPAPHGERTITVAIPQHLVQPFPTVPRLAPAAQRAAALHDQAIDRRSAALSAGMFVVGGAGTTPVYVVVSDYHLDFDCTDRDPHDLDVLLDGAVVRRVQLPCGGSLQAPAPSYSAPQIDAPPGVHRFRVRDIATGVTDFRDFVFPLATDPYVGVTLPVAAYDRSFKIGTPVTGMILRR